MVTGQVSPEPLPRRQDPLTEQRPRRARAPYRSEAYSVAFSPVSTESQGGEVKHADDVTNCVLRSRLSPGLLGVLSGCGLSYFSGSGPGLCLLRGGGDHGHNRPSRASVPSSFTG